MPRNEPKLQKQTKSSLELRVLAPFHKKLCIPMVEVNDIAFKLSIKAATLGESSLLVKGVTLTLFLRPKRPFSASSKGSVGLERPTPASPEVTSLHVTSLATPRSKIRFPSVYLPHCAKLFVGLFPSSVSIPSSSLINVFYSFLDWAELVELHTLIYIQAFTWCLPVVTVGLCESWV